MRIALALACIALAACAADDQVVDQHQTPDDRAAASCERELVSTALWLRFWSPDGTELACADVVARGIVLELDPMLTGAAPMAPAAAYWCDTVAGAARPYGSGVFTFQAPRYTPITVRAVDADGVAVSVPTVVAHDPVECAFGATERHVSMVIR
jgi:hypothetical protein